MPKQRRSTRRRQTTSTTTRKTNYNTNNDWININDDDDNNDDNDSIINNHEITPKCSINISSKCSIRTTPNSRHCCNNNNNNNNRNNKQMKLNRTLNVTNLNILFDSSCINQTTTTTTNEDLQQQQQQQQQTPKTVHKTTQTSNNEEHNPIVETPKLYQINNILNNFDNVNNNNNNDNVVFVDNNVNLNPYINKKDVKIVQKESSFCELSFFNQNNAKSSSTPIIVNNNNNNNTNIENLLKNSPINPNNLYACHRISSLQSSLSSPILIDNDGVGLTNKLQQFDDKNKQQQQCESVVILGSKQLNKLRNLSHNITKSNKIHHYRSIKNNLLKNDGFFDYIKQYPYLWTTRLFNLFNYVTFLFRKKISSFFGFLIMKDIIPSPSTTSSILSKSSSCNHCQCEQEIKNLHIKIDELLMKNEENFLKLQQQYNNELIQIKQQINMMNEQICDINKKSAAVTTTTTTIMGGGPYFIPPIVPATTAAAAPPPPPPLPPPLPPPSTTQQTNKLKITQKTQVKNEDSRPIISLDDILKVKLRKTTERPSPYQRNQPHVSKDMLKEVKLRPTTSRSQQQQPTTPNFDLIDSLSPRSSLTRLLGENSNNTAGWKMKRLKRASGYSCDDVSKRNELLKRDRNGD